MQRVHASTASDHDLWYNMESYNDVSKYSVDELSSFLTSRLEGKVDAPDSIALKFQENKISGLVFLTLTNEELQELIPVIGDRKQVKCVIDSLTEQGCGVVSA